MREQLLKVCINDNERRIVERVSKLKTEDQIFWQDIGKQIPLLIVFFIGSFIFRQHYIFQGMIIAYVWYGLKLNADIRHYHTIANRYWNCPDRKLN